LEKKYSVKGFVSGGTSAALPGLTGAVDRRNAPVSESKVHFLKSYAAFPFVLRPDLLFSYVT